MSFSLDNFYEANRRVMIWVTLIALLWLLRDFFGLIFITFVLAFIAIPLARAGQIRLKLSYRFSLTLVYIIFLVVLGSFIRYVTPSVIGEANVFLNNISEVRQKLIELGRDTGKKYPGLERSMHGYMRSVLDEESIFYVNNQLDLFQSQIALSDSDQVQYSIHNSDIPELQTKLRLYNDKEAELLITSLMNYQMDKIRERLPVMINYLYHGTATMLLALLFSFLILFDSARLGEQMKSLDDSRLRYFYQQTAQPVIRFTYVVGRAIQAQAMIACVNTLLTFVGLMLLDIPSIALLLLIAFVCSFIPVLGVFISTTPMIVVALNDSGPMLAVGVIIMIVIIHVIEAYVLNPMIYGKHLKLNPVLVLIILLIAYHGFGLWGMILGVPVAHYFIHDVFGVPLWDEHHLKPKRPAA